MKVALDAAKGLAYLHSDEAKVIYRDFKTSNILLDTVSKSHCSYNSIVNWAFLTFRFVNDRIIMQNFPILDWLRMDRQVIIVMSLQGLWAHTAMLLLNIWPQVQNFTMYLRLL